MSSGLDRIPEMLSGVKLGKLDLRPRDRFVVACIDGKLDVSAIAELAGLDEQDVVLAVDRLVELNAAQWVAQEGASADPKAVDLTPEQQKAVLEAFEEMNEVGTHYEALGVAEDAGKHEIRHAYFAKSKQFHPDRFFGKNLGTYGSKMEVIFKRLTDAYEVLSKAGSRKEYDEYLEAKATLHSADTIPPGAKRPVGRTSTRPRPGIKIRNKDGSLLPDAPPTRPLDKVKERRAATAREQRRRELSRHRLRGLGKPSRRADAEAQTAESEATNQPVAHGTDKHEILRQLASSLKQTAQFTGGVEAVDRYLSSAKRAESDGDLDRAWKMLRLAVAAAPERMDARAEFTRLNKALQAGRIEEHRKQARYEEDSKMWAAASISWAKVAEGDPEDALAPRRVARALWRAEADLRTARTYAQRSLELEPDNVDTMVLLARIYLGANMENSARRELEEAAKLDPDNQMVNNLLKQLE